MLAPPLICRSRHLNLVAGLSLSLSVTLLFTGCSVAPTYKRPDVPLPQSWQESDAAVEHWPSAQWWQGFGSDELNHYMSMARQNNNDLAAAIARVQQAEQQAGIAGAALYPTIAGSFTAASGREQASNGSFVNYRQYTPQLTASYMLDFWGKNRSAQDAAIATASASRHDQVTVELTVMSNVAQSYFQTIALRERIAVAEQNQASAQSTLKGLQQQLQAGVATALDVAQQETVVANLDAVIPPLRVQQRQAQDALAILTGSNPQSLPETGESMSRLSFPEVSPGLPSQLLQRRPDVAEAEDQLIAANANIGVARAAFFPNIELTGSAGYVSSALAGMTNSANFIHTVAAGIAQPIFDGGAIKGQYEYSKARYDELLANYRKAILSALGNVEDTLAAVKQNSEQVQRLQVAVEKSRRAEHIAKAQLNAGTVSILTVLNTQSALFTAQDALIQAKYAQMQAYVSLFGALGGGWKIESSQP